MKLLIKIAITLILMGIVIWQVGDLRSVGALMTTLDPSYAALGLLVSTFGRALMSYKWGLLLRERQLHLPFFRGMKIYCASCVWGMFLPSTVGADAIRAVSTSRIGLDPVEVIASIIIERIIGFLTALLLGLLGLFSLSLLGVIDPRFDFVWWVGGLMLVSFTIAFAASFSGVGFNLLHNGFLHRFRDARVVRKFRQLHSTYQTYQQNKRVLGTFFGLTFIEQLSRIFFTWVLARGLGVEVDLLFVAGVVPLALIVSRIPVSISGWGIFDGAFLLLMSLAGVAPAESVAIVMVTRIVQIISWLPWWMAEVMNTGKVRPPMMAVEGRPIQNMPLR